MNFILPNWPAPSVINAYTTTRIGWPASYPFIASEAKGSDANQRLQSLLALPADPIWLKQIHSTIVIEASETNIGIEADASFTNQPQHVCAVVTADCLPLLICNKQGTEVAAIHAGWRGLVNGIIENTIQSLQHSGNDLLVWLGPAIGPTVFEVGQDVFDAFVAHDHHAAAAFTPQANNKWLANIYQLARQRLHALGVTAIYGGDYCTLSQQDLFYSYRGEQGKTGRMASVIWIAPT